MSFRCNYCESIFKTDKSLKTHLSSPPRKCIACRVGERDDSEETPTNTTSKPPSELYLKCLEVGKRYVVDRDKNASVISLVRDSNPCIRDISDAIEETTRDLAKATDLYNTTMTKTKADYKEFGEKWTITEAEHNFMVDCDLAREPLLRMKAILQMKMQMVDTMLLNNGNDITVLRRLLKFLKEEMIKMCTEDLKVDTK